MAKESTKEKLLLAAVNIFALKGYRDATVIEICESAGANVAAINYHFGSKEKLLIHAMRKAFDFAEASYPIRGQLNSDASAEERLKAFMTAIINRSFDKGPAGQFNRIMSHEGTRQSGPHDMIVNEVNQLQGALLQSILVELLGTRSEARLHQARMNVIALCVFPDVACRLRKLLFPENPTPAAIRKYINRQVTFALAGMAALAQEGKPKK